MDVLCLIAKWGVNLFDASKNVITIILLSHLYGELSCKNHVRRFLQLVWDKAISWQLRDLHGNYWMYVAVMGYTLQPSGKCHINPVTAMRLATSSSILWKFPCMSHIQNSFSLLILGLILYERVIMLLGLAWVISALSFLSHMPITRPLAFLRI